MTPIVLELPLAGRCLVQNSPADRVPSHGTRLMGSSHAIDLVPVDERGRRAPRGWRSILGSERPESFVGYGMPVFAPVAGRVVVAHDGESDEVARRSAPALVRFAAGRDERMRRGVDGVAGNHVIIQLAGRSLFVALVHLRRGSLVVGVGDTVAAGARIASCGNSGNSTDPHVHLQAMDSTDLWVANGVPIVFRAYRENGAARRATLPRTGAVIEPHA